MSDRLSGRDLMERVVRLFQYHLDRDLTDEEVGGVADFVTILESQEIAQAASDDQTADPTA